MLAVTEVGFSFKFIELSVDVIDMIELVVVDEVVLLLALMRKIGQT